MTDLVETTVASIHRMTPDVRQFVLHAEDHVFEYDPGQHTQVHFEREGEEVVRPYTSTALPGTSRVTLAIKRYPDGTASTWMHDRDPGDTVRIEPLDGNLYLRDLGTDVAFVATGTGLTPMVPMLKQYLREGEGEAALLFGETSQEDLFYRETLDQLAAEHDDLTVAYSLSEESWAGYEGHVQDHLEGVLGTLAGRDFYVCGVPAMVTDTQDRLADAGVDDDRVYTEGWEADATDDEDGDDES